MPSLLEPMGTDAAFGLALDIGLLVLRISDLGLTTPPSFPASPVCRQQIAGILGPHKYVNKFL